MFIVTEYAALRRENNFEEMATKFTSLQNLNTFRCRTGC